MISITVMELLALFPKYLISFLLRTVAVFNSLTKARVQVVTLHVSEPLVEVRSITYLNTLLH